LLSRGEILCGLKSEVGALEPELLTLEAATAAVRFFSQVEHLAAAGKALSARRCAEMGAHRAAGQRSPAEWLSSLTNEPVGQSIGTLETAAGASSAPALDDALRKGELSPAQSREIAAAAALDPDCAEDLVEKAKTASLGDLRRAAEAARRKASSEQSDKERIESIRRRRRLRTWVDPDGAGRIEGLFAPDDFARLRATLDPIAERLFGEARRAGRRETRDTLAADALIEALGGYSGGSGGGRAGSAGAPGAMVRFVVDLEAFFRGEAVGGERCEIPGVGSVPLAMARAVLGDALLELVIRHGVDVVSVTNLGRAVPSAIRRALEERDPRCVVPGCEVTKGLEIDHWQVDFAAGGPTELWNLARICHRHHAMKSYRGYRLEGGPGAWRWLPPPAPGGTSPPGQGPPGEGPPGERPPGGNGPPPARRARSAGPFDDPPGARGTPAPPPATKSPGPPGSSEPPEPPDPPPTLFDIAS
jgi:hypothetical protein